jgi:hypothetical protein
MIMIIPDHDQNPDDHALFLMSWTVHDKREKKKKTGFPAFILFRIRRTIAPLWRSLGLGSVPVLAQALNPF